MEKLPVRKRMRLSGWDYSSEGMYFVTVCTHDRQCLFGEIRRMAGDSVGAHHDAPASSLDKTCVMVYNKYGKIIESVWTSLPDRFPIELNSYQVMPNHIHGIIEISGLIEPNGRAIRELPLRRRSLLSQIIGYFKMNTAKMIHTFSHIDVWQRSFYEHVIRNEKDLARIQEYIINNPQSWDEDEENPNRIHRRGDPCGRPQILN